MTVSAKKNKKIVLIRPRNIYNYNNYPPLGLLCLGAQLEVRGYRVQIINSALEQDSLHTIKDAVRDCLFVGITVLTAETSNAYEIIRYLKEHSTVPIVVGGWHCTLFPEQMAACEYIDYVIAGEGEDHIVQLADMLVNEENNIPRVFGKKICNLDALPMPDYELDKNIEQFITNYLTDKLSEYAKQPMRWLPYESSRGCPSQCTFCINVVANNNQYRMKSAAKVTEEIVCLVNRFKLTHVKIVDDNYFVDVKRSRDIAQGLIEHDLNITWDAECRCDYFNDHMLNDETLALLKRSGLNQLTLGIESGSQHTLDIMKKNISVQDAENAVRKCNEFDIIARSSFMIEVPGETKEDIKTTIAFVNKMRTYPYFTSGVNTFRPYPKCELTAGLLASGLLTEPQSFEEWTNKEAIDLYTAAEYVRPWQIDGNYSESAAYYLNMQSAIRLGNYLIDNVFDRAINSLFIFFARMRNATLFYAFPVEKKLYQLFFDNFYKRKYKKELNQSTMAKKESVAA